MTTKIVELSRKNILFPKWSFLEKLDEELIMRLMPSIKQYGIRTPIIVRPLKHGFFEVVSGRHRLATSDRIGLDKVSCIILKLNDDEAVRTVIDDNMLRRDYTNYEFAKSLQYLLLNFPKRYKSQKTLAQTFSMSESTITEILSILKLEATGKIRARELRQISRKQAANIVSAKEDVKKDIFKRIEKTGKIPSTRDIQKMKKTKIAAQYLCSFCDGGSRIVMRNECSQTLDGLIHSLCGYLVLPINESSILEAPIAVEKQKQDLDITGMLRLREAIASSVQNGDLPMGGTQYGQVPVKYISPTFTWSREKIVLFLNDIKNQADDIEKINGTLTTDGWLVVYKRYNPPLSNEICDEIIEALKAAYAERVSRGEAPNG